MAMSKDQRRQIISKALEVVKRACGGEVKGYAEGGSPKSVLSEATRSPVPEWLLDQQRSVRDGMPMPEGVERRFPSAPFETIGGAAELGAELTGIPSMVRGYGRLTGDGDGWSKARGAGEMAIGALPGVSATARGAAALEPLFATTGKSMATMLGLGLPGAADMVVNSAHAAGMDGDLPSDTLERQKFLSKLGYFAGRIDGKPGPATAEAAKAYMADLAKHRAASVAEKGQDAQIAASQAAAKKADADAELAKTNAAAIKAKQDADAAKDRRRAEGEDRLRNIDANTPWYEPNMLLRKYGPAAGYLAGMVAGPVAAKSVSGVLDRVARTASTRANTVLDSIDPANNSAAAAKLNQFWTEGQARPMLGNRGAPYVSDPTTGKLSANASSPAASELYLPDLKKSAMSYAVPGAAFGVEWGLGQGVIGPEAAAELEKAKAAVAEDPSDINIAAYQKALGTKGFSEFMTNMGRAGLATFGGTALMSKPTRDRPDISRAEQARFDLDSALAEKAGRSSVGVPGSPVSLPSTPGQTLPAPSTGSSGASPTTRSPPQGPTGQSKGGSRSASEASDRPQWASDPPANIKIKKDHYWDANIQQPRHVTGKWGEMPKYSAVKSKTSKGNEPPTPNDIPERNFGGPVVEMARRYANGGVAGLMRYADGGMPEFGAMPPTGPMGEPEGPMIPHGPVHGPDGGRADTRPVSVPDGSFVVPADVVAALGEGNTQAGFTQLDDMFGTAETMHMASGGVPERAVPIMISDGEYVISPSKVAEIGNGNLDVGHKALDKFIVQLRAQNIKKLQSLPGPAKN